MHLWPSTRLRDSFKKDYLNKLQFNFRRQQQQDANSSAKLLNDDDDNNVGQVKKDDGVCSIFCKDFLLIFSLCFCCGGSTMEIAEVEPSSAVKKKAADIASELRGTSIYLVGINSTMKTSLGQFMAETSHYYFFDR